jgi:hypothetical protein
VVTTPPVVLTVVPVEAVVPDTVLPLTEVVPVTVLLIADKVEALEPV